MCARRSPYVACLVDTAQAVVCALSSPQASPSLGPDPRCVGSPACTPVCAHFYVRSKSVRLPVLLQTRPSPPGVTGPLVWLDLRMLRWPLAHPAALASQLPPSGTPNSIAHQHGIPAGSGKSVCTSHRLCVAMAYCESTAARARRAAPRLQRHRSARRAI